jgi:hypothetical protein
MSKLSFKQKVVQGSCEVAVFDLITSTSFDLRPAFALTSQDVTVIVISSSYVTITRSASVGITFRQAIMLFHTLVAISSSDESFAGTRTCDLVAAVIRNDARNVTFAFLTSLRIFCCTVPVAIDAFVTSRPAYKLFAVTFACHKALFFVIVTVANAFIYCSVWFTITLLANLWMSNVKVGILIKAFKAKFTLPAFSVMSAFIAHSSRHISRGCIKRRTKEARVRMSVAVAFFAFIPFLSGSRPPWHVIMIIQAKLAIVALGIMHTVAFAMNHSLDVFMLWSLWQAFLCMTIARA